MGLSGVVGAVRRALARARARTPRRPTSSRLLTGFICLLAGLLVTVSALNARGLDLRPDRHTDLIGLVRAESERNAELAGEASALRAEVDRLAAEHRALPSDEAELAERTQQAGLEPVAGPSLTVTLDDAPSDVAAVGVEEDLLVVHQQDIQAIVNLLWAGGAEAMTIQGQRVISTTGVKCVGNTVVLHGIPYAPPYKISAIGDLTGMQQALADSEFVRIYLQYVERFRLGYSVRTATRDRFPAYQGALDLQYAQARTR
jgi:uncharacterized protein YlxW (UPF0749 family)